MSYLADARRFEPDNILADGLTAFFASTTPEWLGARLGADFEHCAVARGNEP